MTIKVGDKLPSVTLRKTGENKGEPVTTEELCKGKVVVLFGVPGAFTPTCSDSHLPGFLEKADEIRAKGANDIVCVAVNDFFVMSAWAEAKGVGDKITMVADANAEFAKATGLELDLSERGLGLRCQRFAMIVEDMEVKSLEIEDVPSKAEKTSAEKLLERMAEAYLQKRDQI